MLIKMFKSSNDARKGFSSSNDFFPSKAFNYPSESKQMFFQTRENPGKDFSKKKGRKLKIFFSFFF